MMSSTSGNKGFSFAPVGAGMYVLPSCSQGSRPGLNRDAPAAASSDSCGRSDTSCSAGRAVPSRREGGRIRIRRGAFRLSGASGTAQDSCGKRDDGVEKLQDPADCDADNPERQQEQPHQRIKHQGEDRHRPAENSQDAPEKELDHRVFLSNSPLGLIRRTSEKVPCARLGVESPIHCARRPTAPAEGVSIKVWLTISYRARLPRVYPERGG